MKKTILLFVLPFFTFLIGCSSYLTQEQSEKVFTHEVKLNQDGIRKKLLLYVNEKFISGKEVVQSNEDGLFTGNGIVNVPYSSFGVGSIQMELTFIVKYSDNNYRVKWIVKNLMSNSENLSQGIWGSYSDGIEKSILDNDNLLFNYIANKDNEF